MSAVGQDAQRLRHLNLSFAFIRGLISESGFTINGHCHAREKIRHGHVRFILHRSGRQGFRGPDQAFRLIDFLVDRLRERQQTVAELRGRIHCAASAIAGARRLRAGESLDTRFGILHEEQERLTRGDDPLDVIEWTLSEGHPWGFCGGGAPVDPLADYRL